MFYSLDFLRTQAQAGGRLSALRDSSEEVREELGYTGGFATKTSSLNIKTVN